ncbi:MAG: MFS transporter [Labedaea sp.]
MGMAGRTVDRRNARLYLLGVGASQLGDTALSLVAGIWVKTLTGSSSAAALVAVCVYGPSLCGPVAGLLADRVRVRTLLLVVNLTGAVLVLPLLLVDSAARAWLIYAVMLGYGTVAVIIDSAETALFVVMLPQDVRRSTNGMRLTLGEGAKLVAPVLGAGVFAALGGGVVAAIDAATFALAALMIGRLRVSAPKPVPRRRHWRAELTAGLRHIGREADLRAMVFAGAAAMLISGVASAAQYSLVDALHRAPAFLGVLAGALGAGSILAGLTSAPLISRVGERRLALLGLMNGVLASLLRLLPWTPAAVLSWFVAGFALPWLVLAVINLTQRRTPNELQGRVASAVTLALFANQPLAHALGAWAVGRVSYQAIYAGAAAVTLAVGIRLARSPADATGE